MSGSVRRKQVNAMAGVLVACSLLGASLAPASGETPRTPNGPAGKGPVAQPSGKPHGTEKPSSVFDEGYLPLTVKKDPPPAGTRTTPDRR